jgi:hypothetical protein
VALTCLFFVRRRRRVMRFCNVDAGNPAAFHGYASLVALLAVKLFHS